MSPALAWGTLLLAGVLDVAWAVTMKQAEGWSRPGWTLASLACLAGFVALLGRALAVLPVGTAYAVWTGIGAVGTVLAGAWFWGEALTAVRLGGVALVIGGIAVLKLSAG